MKNQKSKKATWIKRGIGAIILVSIGGLFAWNHINADTARQHSAPQTFILERTDMIRTISASGVVQSSETFNIFSMQNSPVQEVFVSVGDNVRVGDVLAKLDMSRLESDLEQAELNLITAQNNAAEEARTNSNAVVNSRNSVDASRIALSRQQLSTSNAQHDLQEAEADISEPFDSAFHERVIEDARLNVARRTTDLRDAEQDLQEVIHDFDDFIFRNAITEARVVLDRRITALEEAEADLEEELRARADDFDSRHHQNAIDDAQRALNRLIEDERTARDDLENAREDYWWASNMERPAARNAVDAAQARLDNTVRQVEDARIRLSRARTDLATAIDDHDERESDMRDNIIDSLETVVENSQNARDDAQRAYDRAIADLERAQDNAFEQAENHLTRMYDNLADAIRAYERALSDKERAIEDHIDLNTTRLDNARRAFRDSQIQLENAQNSLQSAQNNLNQAQERPTTADTNVEIQLINIERLNNQLVEGLIIATADGVITEVNARVGAAPTGILFVIEDIDNLYISANVREHSLGDLHLGQRGFVTTIATGDHEYHAEVAFISPRAVSPAGSTNVEFEVRAAITDICTNVRIGMNAFLNVITDTRYNVFAMPLSAIVTNDYGSFIYVQDYDEPRQIPITIGLRTSTQAEIFGDDLHEGLVVFSRPQEARRG